MKKQSRTYRIFQHFFMVYAGVSIFISTFMLSCNQVQQLSPSPSETFFKVFGGGYDQQAADILQIEDGSFLLFGSTKSFSNGNNWDMFLVKTDPDGNELWSKNYDFEGADDVGNVIIAAHDGEFILCGTSSTDDGNQIVRLLKIDTNGEILWANLEEWIGTGEDIVQTSDRGYVLVGATSQIDPLKADGFSPLAKDSTDILAIKVDENGQEVWRKAYGYKGVDKGVAIQALENNRYVLLGTTDFPENGNIEPDFMFVLINKEGNPVYTENLGANATSEIARDVALASNGDFMLLGTENNVLRLQKITSSLDVVPKVNLEGIQAGSITALQAGGYMIMGTAIEANQQGKDILLIQTDDDGNRIWGRTYGSTGNDIGARCIPLDQGGFAFTGTIGFGANTMIGLFKINQNGHLLPQ